MTSPSPSISAGRQNICRPFRFFLSFDDIGLSDFFAKKPVLTIYVDKMRGGGVEGLPTLNISSTTIYYRDPILDGKRQGHIFLFVCLFIIALFSIMSFLDLFFFVKNHPKVFFVILTVFLAAIYKNKI